MGNRKHPGIRVTKQEFAGVLQEVLHLPVPPEIHSIEIRKLSTICRFSSCDGEMILKIPRSGNSRHSSENQRRLHRKAELEWEALNHFFTQTRENDSPISFITPIAFAEPLSGVITRLAEGRDLLEMLRKAREAGGRRANQGFLETVGEGVAYLHSRNEIPTDTAEAEPTRFEYCGFSRETNNKVQKLLRQPSKRVKSMSGFALTDIVIGEKGEVYFLDPGKLETRSIYDDLSKMIVDLRKLNSNRMLFPFLKPDMKLEQAFLHGYSQKGETFDKPVLGAFVLQRLVADYYAEKDAPARRLSHRFRPKSLIHRAFGHRFYEQEIENTLNQYRLS